MNIILNNKEREKYKDVIKELFELCPETMIKKIPEANVQQAFVFDYARKKYKEGDEILSIGAYEDTASESLRKIGCNIIEIDPDNVFFPKEGNVNHIINIDLNSYYEQNKDKKFDIIISTSVIEHVQNDEQFVDEICKLLKESGIAILTCDFKDEYKYGDLKPGVDFRLYTKNDLLVRLKSILDKNNCELVGDINYDSPVDFTYGNCVYSFATYVFKKN